MTSEELAAIRVRAERATAGPWVDTTKDKRDASESEIKTAAGTHVLSGCGCCGSPDMEPADRTFVVHARSDIPALLDEVNRLRQENIQLGEQMTSLLDEVMAARRGV